MMPGLKRERCGPMPIVILGIEPPSIRSRLKAFKQALFLFGAGRNAGGMVEAI
jgi:hypothetical protein